MCAPRDETAGERRCDQVDETDSVTTGSWSTMVALVLCRFLHLRYGPVGSDRIYPPYAPRDALGRPAARGTSRGARSTSRPVPQTLITVRSTQPTGLVAVARSPEALGAIAGPRQILNSLINKESSRSLVG